MKIGFVNTAIRERLSFDDEVLATALRAAGHEVTCVFWDNPDERFENCDLYINRSCFEYHKHPESYGAWLDSLTARNIPFLNPVDVIKSNMCKSYLQDMAQKNAAIIPTLFIRNASYQELQEQITASGWTELVCKPFVGAASHNLKRIDTAAISADDFSDYRTESGAYELLVQPFWTDFAQSGEISFIFFGTDYAHAIIKKPAAEDFRVQGRFGGTCARYDAAPAHIAQARDSLIASGFAEDLLYARVDGVIRDGKFYLSELEINEPWLFFTEAPESCELFRQRMEQMIKATTETVTNGQSNRDQMEKAA